MNETLHTILTRRSCRKFLSTPVEREKTDRVIEAGLYAASGKNQQSPAIIAVTNAEVRRRLTEVNAEILGRPGFDPFYGAPVILIVLARTDCPNRQYDGSLTLGNMMLAAHAEGLASCWIHRALQTFDRPEWKAWLAEIGIDPSCEYEGVGQLALGYPDGQLPAAPPRREGRVYRVD